MSAPLGVILAGGRATRMGGGDKALQLLGGQTLLAHVIARFDTQVADLAINANGDPTRFAAHGLPVLADPVPEHPGPLAGILAGLQWGAAMGASDIVTVAADTPFLPHDLVARLVAARGDQPIALAQTADGRHPTFGLWPTTLASDLAAALVAGARRVVTWADGHGAACADFEDEGAFFNINTPADLARAEEVAR